MRGSRLSCVLCTLLSLFMVMPASVASAATEGSGGSGEVTIHYYDSAGWAKPFSRMTVAFGRPVSMEELGLTGEYSVAKLRGAKQKYLEALRTLYEENKDEKWM